MALATTYAYEAVPPGAGVPSTDPDVLADAARHFTADLDLARAYGEKARQAAPDRYGLGRLLRDWDEVLTAVAA
ncbi:glycosyltransferase [Pseudofrankia inefficax]|uniref:glycosyltransferase n=1 Tax=Pseudofrankia inefficax (strain DSM 45817 / CECT 9037 / DDB 130130 / EuI1c) TaxID=298654 RepID=UPI0001BFB78F|nr:hypothetical protein [Pseudofrankia inefficax]